MACGPPWGYFLDLTKIILVVSTHKVERAEHFFRGRGLTIVTGSRYLGGYINDAGPHTEWLSEKVQDWAGGVTAMLGVARNHT